MAGQFTLDLSRMIRRAKGNTEVAVRKIMIEAFTGVVQMSPVDTGRFRANWTVGLGGYSTSTTTDTDKTGAGASGRIVTEISTARIGNGSIYLTNSLPYAVELENGSSRQAPSGMVGATLARINAKYGA